jgi:hypothetical protein
VSKFLTAPDLGPPISRGALDSQQNQQLELAGGCNAIIPRDFVVRGSGSIHTVPTMQLIDMHGLPFGLGHIWTQNAGYFLRRVTLL